MWGLEIGGPTGRAAEKVLLLERMLLTASSPPIPRRYPARPRPFRHAMLRNADGRVEDVARLSLASLYACAAVLKSSEPQRLKSSAA